MASSLSKRRILITGPPGVGKITLITKVCKELSRRQTLCVGFFTEEVRQNGQRIGFDVVSLCGNRGPLARNSTTSSGPYRVGKYSVDLKSFENIALPSLKENTDAVIVIDEIGKMELFSKCFEETVQTLFNKNQPFILATIPITTSRPIPLVNSLKSRNDIQLINVSRENRNDLVQLILDAFTK